MIQFCINISKKKKRFCTHYINFYLTGVKVRRVTIRNRTKGRKEKESWVPTSETSWARRLWFRWRKGLYQACPFPSCVIGSGVRHKNVSNRCPLKGVWVLGRQDSGYRSNCWTRPWEGLWVRRPTLGTWKQMKDGRKEEFRSGTYNRP